MLKIGNMCWFLVAMIAHKMKPKVGELKKNIDQWFEAQSKMIKSGIHDVCALIESFQAIF